MSLFDNISDYIIKKPNVINKKKDITGKSVNDTSTKSKKIDINELQKDS